MNIKRILFACFVMESKSQLLYRVMPNDEPLSLDRAQTDNIEFFSWAETASGRLVIGSRNRLLIYESNKNGYLEEVSSITMKPEAITKSNCQRSGGTEEDCDNCLVAIGIDEESIWACGTYAHRPMLYYFENGQPSYRQFSSMTCPKSNRRSAFLKIAKSDTPALFNATSTANFEEKSIFIASDDPNHAYLEKSLLNPVKTVLESESFSSEYHNEKQWFEAPDMHLLVDLPERVLLIFAGGHPDSRRNLIGSVLKSDRVALNDSRTKFASFRKVPFVCRSTSSATFTFDNLATAIEGQDGFLAIFKTVNGRGKYESAMCSYSYDEIRRYFESGEFGPHYEAVNGRELVSSPLVLIEGEVIAALQSASSADQFFFGLSDGKVVRVTVRPEQEPVLANIDSPDKKCGKVKSLLMRRKSGHLVIAWEKCLLETKGDNFHVNEEQSPVDRKEIESVFQDRLSEMESKMNDLHDIINALTARIYTENDNRSLGDVLGDFDMLKVKVESAEEIAQRRVDEIYEKLEKRIVDLDRRASQCCSKPSPNFRLNHVMQLDEPVSVVAEKLNQIERQMDDFDKETKRLKSDQKELQSGTWTYTKQVVDNMRKFCYQKQKTSMNWVVDLKSNVTELAETINEVSGQLRRVKRRVDKKGRKNRRKRKTGKKPREYELVIPELSLTAN